MLRPCPFHPPVAAALTLGLIFCGAASATAQDTDVFPTLGRLVALDDGFAECVDPTVKIEVLASGFSWCEGPAWDAAENHLLFSEIPSNTVRVWEPKKAARVFLDPSGYTGQTDYGAEPGSNGLLIVADADGSNRRLISCEHGDRRLSVMPLDRMGGKVTLVDRFEGKRLNSPNDVCRRSDGTYYFTDPPYGMPGGLTGPHAELDFCGVYRLTPQGDLHLVTKAMPRPNGIALSPDERTLYVADSGANHWMKFPVAEDGSTGEGEIFFDAADQRGPGSADGLKVDAEGRVWATGPGGVWVFAPNGKPLGRVETGERCSNVAFGGPDGTDLFITSDMYLCRVKTKTTGAAK